MQILIFAVSTAARILYHGVKKVKHFHGTIYAYAVHTYL